MGSTWKVDLTECGWSQWLKTNQIDPQGVNGRVTLQGGSWESFEPRAKSHQICFQPSVPPPQQDNANSQALSLTWNSPSFWAAVSRSHRMFGPGTNSDFLEPNSPFDQGEVTWARSISLNDSQKIISITMVIIWKLGCICLKDLGPLSPLLVTETSLWYSRKTCLLLSPFPWMPPSRPPPHCTSALTFMVKLRPGGFAVPLTAHESRASWGREGV